VSVLVLVDFLIVTGEKMRIDQHDRKAEASTPTRPIADPPTRFINAPAPVSPAA
jgi:hypothetical protein